MSCEFSSGGLASTVGLTDTYEGEVTGTISETGDVDGTISVAVGDGFSEDWTGSFVGTTLSSSFDGTFTYSGFSLAYTGSFSASKI